MKILNTSDNPNPEYKTEGSAGFDIAVSKTTVISSASASLVPTGIHVIIPQGYEGQLRLRSSMWKKAVIMPNAPGTIDSDYRGEIKIPIRNVAPYQSITLEKGERIAQLVISKVSQKNLEYVTAEEFSSYDETLRGSGGFGSTVSGIPCTGL